jgi:hypothetical protein
MTKEHVLMNNIRLWAASQGHISIRYNVGSLKNGKNLINCGPPKGHPDLILYTKHAETVFIEAKIKPNKPSSEQINFLQKMRDFGFVALVVYSMEQIQDLPIHSWNSFPLK